MTRPMKWSWHEYVIIVCCSLKASRSLISWHQFQMLPGRYSNWNCICAHLLNHQLALKSSFQSTVFFFNYFYYLAVICCCFVCHQIPISAVVSFVEALEVGYSKHKNPYHNLMHAADVTQTVHYLLLKTGMVVSRMNCKPKNQKQS